jgi:hypothetical protein
MPCPFCPVPWCDVMVCGEHGTVECEASCDASPTLCCEGGCSYNAGEWEAWLARIAPILEAAPEFANVVVDDLADLN